MDIRHQEQTLAERADRETPKACERIWQDFFGLDKWADKAIVVAINQPESITKHLQCLGIKLVRCHHGFNASWLELRARETSPQGESPRCACVCGHIVTIPFLEV